MPKTQLQLTLSWDELEVSATQKCRGAESEICDSTCDDYELAKRLGDDTWGKPYLLPYPWHDILDQLPNPTSLSIRAHPVDGLHRARYFFEVEEDQTKAYQEWLNYTHPTWIAHEKEKMPDAHGFPDKEDPRHLAFSAKSLMMLMHVPDIHDVLYTDDYYPDYWDWKQKLLYKLQPTRMGLGTA